jgi:glutamyl-tRNA reductase
MLTTANEESEKLLRSMPDLSEDDRHRIQMMYERFVKKMANDFLYKVKAENSPEDVQVFLKCLDSKSPRN